MKKLRYYPDHKALFLHIPRTGGTWAKQTLISLGVNEKFMLNWIERPTRRCSKFRRFPKDHSLLQHHCLRRAPQIDFIFSFVRHPLSYYNAVWNYLRVYKYKQRWPHVWGPLKIPALLWSDSYEQWIDHMLVECPLFVTRTYEQFVGPRNAEFCNYIGRTETLTKDFKEICGYLNIDCSDVSTDKINAVEYEKSMYRADEILNSERLAVDWFYSDETIQTRRYKHYGAYGV